MRMALTVDRAGWRTAGVQLHQEGDELHGRVVRAGAVSGELTGAVREQVRHVLSLDVDGAGFAEIGARDAVVGELQRRRPGLRPVLFRSPYEAAAWTIIGQRIRMAQASAISAELARDLGEPVDFGDERLHAFPAPERLAALPEGRRGLNERKIAWLRALGEAALRGELDAAALRARPAEQSLDELRRLPGIGPFAAELVLVRGAGEPDRFPETERRFQGAMRAAYGLPDSTPVDELRAIAEGWRPYRSWVALLLRASPVG
jgi:DNA-3-methyladenine glycosylase II